MKKAKIKLHLPADWALRFLCRVEQTAIDKRKSRNSKAARRELRKDLELG